MSLRVLVTGNNKKLASDISSHLEKDRGYIAVRCPAIHSELYDITLAELPRVIVICLGNESVETIKTYNILKDVTKKGMCTIIVLTTEDDEKFFMKYSTIPKVFFLSRPVSLFALYEKILEVEQELNDESEERKAAFREYSIEEAESTGKRHILVVDDDSEQLANMREQLCEFYDVSLVKSGTAALKLLTKKKVDLILLDYLMPDENGPQVFRRLKATQKFADIPVIFLTGMTEKNAVIHTLTELKPQGYIVKPAKKSEVVAKIIDVLG